MRFLSAQFEALLAGDLWLAKRPARQRDGGPARRRRSESIEGVEITHPVEANAVFARLDGAAIDRLLDGLPGDHPFYVWDAAGDEVRWMCSWDTTRGRGRRVRGRDRRCGGAALSGWSARCASERKGRR